MEKLDKELFEEFISTTIQIKRALNDSFGMGSTHPNVARSTMLQHQILLYLLDNPGISVKILANKFLMSSASIAQLLNRLENRKFIKKVQDNKDKRITHLYITKIGTDEIKNLKMLLFKKASQILKFIPEEDLRNMVRIQKNLLHQLEKEYKYV
jgi:DNA-binding MarR family transcriptional regulator